MSKSYERSRARRFLLQALYQWQFSHQEPTKIRDQFLSQTYAEAFDAPYFSESLLAIVELIDELEEQLAQAVNIPLPELDPVERAVLLIGTYELQHRLDVPYKAVISEGINLAKRFGATESHKFINGVLDKLAHTLRPREL